jgi:hypothetical protein
MTKVTYWVVGFLLSLAVGLGAPRDARAATCYYCFYGAINGIAFGVCDEAQGGASGRTYCRDEDVPSQSDCYFGPSNTCSSCTNPLGCGGDVVLSGDGALVRSRPSSKGVYASTSAPGESCPYETNLRALNVEQALLIEQSTSSLVF